MLPRQHTRVRPDVSILITNWNTKDLLRDCIRSVYKQTTGITYEMIVVDDASNDGSADLIRKEFPEIVLILNEKNVGFAAANNVGVQRATGRYVLLLNSDTLLIQNALKVLVDFMDAHLDVGVCGGWLKNRDMTSQVSFGNFPSFVQAFVDALFLNDLFPEWHFPNRGIKPDISITKPIVVDYITGADIVIRKELIDQMGLFDERFQAYCEETDFCYRVKYIAKLKSYFVPEAEIIHFGGMSYGKLGKRQIQIHYSSYNKFLRKHHGAVYSFCTRLLYAWHFSVKMMTRLIRYLAAPAEVREARRNYMFQAWYAVRYNLVPSEQSTGT